jgi:hypothetical protein
MSTSLLPEEFERMTVDEITAYLLAADDDVAESDRMAHQYDDRPHPDGA